MLKKATVLKSEVASIKFVSQREFDNACANELRVRNNIQTCMSEEFAHICQEYAYLKRDEFISAVYTYESVSEICRGPGLFDLSLITCDLQVGPRYGVEIGISNDFGNFVRLHDLTSHISFEETIPSEGKPTVNCSQLRPLSNIELLYGEFIAVKLLGAIRLLSDINIRYQVSQRCEQ